MKKLLLFLLPVIFLFTGCSDDDKVIANLELDKPEITFEMAGASNTFNITCNVSWEITGMPDWVTVDPSSGKGDAKVTVSVKANDGGNRNATLTIKAGDAPEQEIKIIQNGIEPVISVDPNVLNFEVGEGKDSVTVTSNGNFSVEVLGDDWCYTDEVIGTSSMQIMIFVKENTDVNGRENKVVFRTAKNNNVTDTVTIYQDGVAGRLFISPTTSDTSDYKGKTFDLKISSNLPWAITGDTEWCTIDINSGEGDQTIKITTKQNDEVADRKTTLTITATGVDGTPLTKEFIVYQKAFEYFITAITELKDFSHLVESDTFLVLTNASSITPIKPEWVSLTHSIIGRDEVLRNDTIRFIVTTTERTDTIFKKSRITITGKKGTSDVGVTPLAVEVYQHGKPYFWCSYSKDDTIKLPASIKDVTNTQKVRIKANRPWKVEYKALQWAYSATPENSSDRITDVEVDVKARFNNTSLASRIDSVKLIYIDANNTEQKLLIPIEQTIMNYPKDDDLSDRFKCAVFKAIVLKAYDKHPEDGKLSTFEAMGVTSITYNHVKAVVTSASSDLTGYVTSFKGVEIFENLTDFTPGATSANGRRCAVTDTIDLSSLAELKTVLLQNDYALKGLKLPSAETAPNLGSVTISNTSIGGTWEFKNYSQFKTFKASATPIDTIKLSNLPLLETLTAAFGINSDASYIHGADYAGIKSVTLNNCGDIGKGIVIDLTAQPITELDLSTSHVSGTLALSATKLTSLDISNQPLIAALTLSNTTELKTLVLPDGTGRVVRSGSSSKMKMQKHGTDAEGNPTVTVVEDEFNTYSRLSKIDLNYSTVAGRKGKESAYFGFATQVETIDASYIPTLMSIDIRGGNNSGAIGEASSAVKNIKMPKFQEYNYNSRIREVFDYYNGSAKGAINPNTVSIITEVEYTAPAQ